jgi:hypothetical protein
VLTGVRLTSSERDFHRLIVGTELRHLKKASMLMSALGHKRTLKHVRPMSALPPKADIAGRQLDVRFVPKAHSCSVARKLLVHLVGNREQRRAHVEAAGVTDVDPTAPPSAT